MDLVIAPGEVLQFNDVRITHKNFAGIGSIYNREGDRNFAIIIDDEDLANELIEAGWNIKIKAPRNEGDSPFMFMPVKIKFNEFGPTAILVTGNRKIRLDEETIHRLDRISMSRVDVDIRPYDWELPSGKKGRAAYLKGIRVEQNIDRFAAELAEEEYPGEAPWN